jgi:hypothetical protein
MPVMLKVALMFGATWLGPLIVSLICTGVTAGLTSRWSASRVGGVMLLVMALDLVFASVGSFVFWRALSAAIPATAPRVVTFLGHTALQLATLAVLILGTFVAFNR